MKLANKVKLHQVLTFSQISIWFTPFAAAMLPIIFLAAEHSIEDIKLYEIFGPIIVTWIALLIGMAGTSIFVHINYKIANLGTWVVLIYWGYVVLLALNEYMVNGVVVFRGLFLLPTFMVIMLLGAWYIIRSKRWSGNVLLWINTLIVLLLIFNLSRLMIQRIGPDEYAIPPEFAQYMDVIIPSQELPDIYYFLFDGYGRADMLRNYFDFDNSIMLSHMKQLGFMSLDDSSANYPYTRLSLTTTFNMQHLYNKSKKNIKQLIKSQRGLMDRQITFANSVVGQLAGGIGYDLYAYNSQSEIDYNTRRFSVRSAIFSPFSEMLIDAGVLGIVKRNVAGLWRRDYGQHNFPKHMPAVVSLTNERTPTFAFVYNLPPRPPLIFKRDGSLVDDWEVEYVRLGNRWIPGEKYIDQIVYVNSVLIETVESILTNSRNDPIIIVQSDHGPGTNRGLSNNSANPSDDLLLERTGILNLMYLPEICKIDPRLDMTAVNTFRFIFSTCFGFEMPMLEDKLFWSLPDEIEFVPINFR